MTSLNGEENYWDISLDSIPLEKIFNDGFTEQYDDSKIQGRYSIYSEPIIGDNYGDSNSSNKQKESGKLKKYKSKETNLDDKPIEPKKVIKKPASKIKSYSCLNCKQSFTRKFNLKAHMRVYTGETPYKCEVAGCGKRFKWLSSSNHHKEAHERNKHKLSKLA